MKMKKVVTLFILIIIYNNGYSQKLFDAVENNDLGKVTLLIEKGANVNMKRGNGYNPLFSACAKGHREIVELLVSKGANVNAQLDNGLTSLGMTSQEGF